MKLQFEVSGVVMTVSTTASKYLLQEVVPEYDKPTNMPSEPCAEYSHGVLAVHPRFWLGRAPRLRVAWGDARMQLHIDTKNSQAERILR